jgi:hypothetical protein
MRGTGAALSGVVVALAALFAAPRARADEPAPAAEQKGFGERGSVLFSVESVFGILQQDYFSGGNGNNNGGFDTGLNHAGFFPAGLVGTRLAVHGLTEGGITYGGIVGFATASDTGSSDGHTTVLQLGPRIGYAGALPKFKPIGYWARIGPTLQYVDSGSHGSSLNLWLLDLSIEAFIVWTPVEHFGVLAGPSFDIGLAGHESSPNGGSGQDVGYKSVGVSLGLVFDL